MKRYSMLLIVFSLLLVFVCAGASFAIFPGHYSQKGDGTVQVNLKQGWWSGAPAWYSCFATNNVATAQTQGLTLSTLLSNAATTVAAPTVYMVTNFNQGPVFSASPVPAVNTYTGLWTVSYITWNAGVTRVPITDAAALPVGITVTPTTIVVDCPIFAIGPIGNPWGRTTSTTSPYIYRIRQGRSVNTYTKQLTIPFWYAYCQNPTTRRISARRVIIPDASYAALATLIGANFATNLGQLVLAGRGQMVVIDWNQIVAGAVVPLPVNQYPVLANCPSSTDWRNINRSYSPAMSFSLLDRNLALITPGVLFNNLPFIQQQFTAGALTDTIVPYQYPPVLATAVVNAPVLSIQ